MRQQRSRDGKARAPRGRAPARHSLRRLLAVAALPVAVALVALPAPAVLAAPAGPPLPPAALAAPPAPTATTPATATTPGAVAPTAVAPTAAAPTAAAPPPDPARPAPLVAPAVPEAAPPARPRKRVALVLSGGGARGLAHVGVFKALDQLRIPYDCIVGTSMGAIAGGTLAAGTPLAAAERKVVEADWDAVFADRPARSDIPYYRKSEDERPYFAFDLTLDDFHPVTPRNFVSVQHINLFFRELTGARAAAHFDDLPIPFRAVGTDIVSGETVVMDKGTVADVMRASMTVPGLFAPHDYEGHQVVDGGLATNLPVALGQQLCGDVVIAVNVTSPNLRADQLDSVVAIAEQVVNISMSQKLDAEIARLRPWDVLLVPDLDDIASTDFKRVREIIARGEQVVLSHAAHLRELQVGEAEYAAWRQAVAARVPSRPVVERVEMAGTRWVNPAVMSDLLRLRPGLPFDMAALHRNIERVYARGDFTQVSYDLANTGPGTAALYIDPQERPGRDFVRFGLGLYTDFTGDSRFLATASLRRAWLNRLDGQWRTDVGVGRDVTLHTEWYQPASLGSELFVAPQAFYTDQHRDLRFSRDTRFGYRYSRTGAALEVGSVFGRFGEVRAGVTNAYASVSPETGTVIPDQSWHQGGFTLRSTYDQLDSIYFPHRGGAARLAFYASRDDMGADLNYDRLEFQARRALTRGRTTLVVALQAASSLDTTLPLPEAFGLGGLFNLSAYPPNYYLGEELVSGRLLVYRPIGAMPAALGRGIYAGTALEAGRMRRMLPGHAEPDAAYSAGAYLAADTVLGPAYLMAALGDRQQRALYLALGVRF